MMFDWSEFLNFSESLIDNTITCDDEAKYRAAVSRAYYAAHGTAREKLEIELRTTAPSKKVHQWVIDGFRNSTDKTRCAIASSLDLLFTNRVKADYRGNAIIQEPTAKFSNNIAKEIIRQIRTL